MAIADVNSILRAYLVTCGTLIALIGGANPRIYCPRLPENCALPAIGFFVRGGSSTPYIPGIVTPSFQIDAWANNPLSARALYNELYSNLQGIQNITVAVDGTDYEIMSAIEEVQGQDLQDVDIPTYFRVLAMFSIMIRAE